MAKLSLGKAKTALITHHGILSKAAEACGVTRKAFYDFIEKNPELEQVRAEASEILLDVAEAHVVDAINGADMKTVRWHLERKGKDRGYTTRQEMTGKDGEPLETQVIERRVVDPNADD